MKSSTQCLLFSILAWIGIIALGNRLHIFTLLPEEVDRFDLWLCHGMRVVLCISQFAFIWMAWKFRRYEREEEAMRAVTGVAREAAHVVQEWADALDANVRCEDEKEGD